MIFTIMNPSWTTNCQCWDERQREKLSNNSQVPTPSGPGGLEYIIRSSEERSAQCYLTLFSQNLIVSVALNLSISLIADPMVCVYSPEHNWLIEWMASLFKKRHYLIHSYIVKGEVILRYELSKVELAVVSRLGNWVPSLLNEKYYSLWKLHQHC